MLDRTAEFDKEIKRSHFSLVRLDLYRRGELRFEDLDVLGGDWSDDKTASIRRRGTLQLPPIEELIPSRTWEEDAGLWPVGNEIQLKVGVKYTSGAEELLDVARLRISRPTVVDDGDALTLGVEGFDRSRSVSRARFTQPYVVVAGSDYATAIHDLILSRIPSLREDEFIFMRTDGSGGSSSFKTPLLTFMQDDDPWAMATEMAQSCGAELFFDGSGRCVLRPERDPSHEDPDWEYHEGKGTNLLSVDRSLDDEQAYNGVIVDSSNTELTAPIHAEYWDANPASSTYYDPGNPDASVYGPVPFFMESQYITTQAQANAAASNNFLRVSGLTEKISFSAIKHPAHEAGDILSMRRGRVKLEGVYVMDSFNCGLGVEGTMSGTTRERRVR
jgi:hypothetical protein